MVVDAGISREKKVFNCKKPEWPGNPGTPELHSYPEEHQGFAMVGCQFAHACKPKRPKLALVA